MSTHLHGLADARLIDIEQDGHVRRCPLDPAPLRATFGWMPRDRVFWEDRFDALAIRLEDDDQ